MEYFNFESSEFQILEDIEFDEEIQRPSEIRFYTLEEQTVDAFEKMMPKQRITQYEIDKIRKEITRLKDLYSDFVEQTPEDYKLKPAEYQKQFDWVYPVYATGDRKEYDYGRSWVPLYENVNVPNFYPRMISALPKPYDETGGLVYTSEKPVEFLDSDGHSPMRTLPIFQITKTQYHEDRTFDVIRIGIPGSEDRLGLIGYYLTKRPLDVPNPLAEHPFLKGNESTFIETTEPLQDVAPSLDAVITHAIPTTTDPYGEAMPFLKLYNVQLQDIPWNLWKSKFPQPESVPGEIEQTPLEFPTPQTLKPSDNIIQEYKHEYFPGVSPRLWLMQQEDGGELVIQMLLSQAIENGSVGTVPDLSVSNYPATSIDECLLSGLNFQDFTVRGILRRTGEKNYTCIPLEFVKQERARLGYINRKPWKETTGFEILDTYRRRLRANQRVQTLSGKSAAESKTPARPESEKRKEILLVLNDRRRFAEDKVRDTGELLKDATLTDKIYTDNTGEFVLCSHTLAVLAGDFKADKHKFYETWSAQDDGFRVCKYCGEQISSLDLVNQTEFDQDGYVINQTDVLEEKTAGIDHGFTNELQKLTPLFVLTHPSDTTILLLLSILHVLPNAQVLEPFIKMGRAFANKQFGEKENDQVKKFKGIVGLAMTILVLQTHIPLLVPRRSFGSRPVLLSGYPRDADTPADYSIIDSLMMVLRKTFEAFPTSFKGPSQQLIRGILNKPSEIKNAVKVLLDKTFLKDKSVEAAMDKARAFVREAPPEEQPDTLIPIVFPPKELNKVQSFPKCVSERPIFASDRQPTVVQKTVPLRNGIQASPMMQEVTYSPSTRDTPVEVPKATIQQRLRKKIATKFKVPTAYVTNIALTSRIADMTRKQLPIRTVDPNQQADQLRDIGQGLLYEALGNIEIEPIRKRDPALYTLTADYFEEKAGVNKLRAQERLKFVQEMALRSDQEREIMGELLKIGIAPYIITIRDRESFAAQAETLRNDVDDMMLQEEQQEVGVGMAQDYYDQGDEHIQGVDAGNYGDYTAQPRNDGRDPQQPAFWDDDNEPI